MHAGHVIEERNHRGDNNKLTLRQTRVRDSVLKRAPPLLPCVLAIGSAQIHVMYHFI